MSWFRRLTKEAPEEATPIQLPIRVSSKARGVIDEGMLIILATLRMRVKNELITKLLRDGSSFNRSSLLMLVEEGIASLVHEKETAVAYLTSTMQRARKRGGIPEHSNDYRKADVRGLELRIQVEHGLAETLRAALDDTEMIDKVVDDARQSALDEIIRPLKSTRLSAPIPISPDQKARALQSLAADLGNAEQEFRTGKPAAR